MRDYLIDKLIHSWLFSKPVTEINHDFYSLNLEEGWRILRMTISKGVITLFNRNHDVGLIQISAFFKDIDGWYYDIEKEKTKLVERGIDVHQSTLTNGMPVMYYLRSNENSTEHQYLFEIGVGRVRLFISNTFELTEHLSLEEYLEATIHMLSSLEIRK